MNPFESLGLPPSYDVDLRAAEKVHRDLSKSLHPDRHVGSGASTRRDALDRAVEVNEAWRIVRDPIRRGEALFTLAGITVGDTHEPKPSPALLMEMMDLREELSDARHDGARVHALVERMTARDRKVQEELGAGFREAAGDAGRLTALLPKLGELRYLRRFLEEASAFEDELASAS